MTTLLLTGEKTEEKSSFQAKCTLFSKQCAVLLGFVIPLSTAATHVILLLLMIAWFLAGDIKNKMKIIWVYPIARAFLLLFGIFMVGALYSVAPSADRIAALNKASKLLYFIFLLPLMREKTWRFAAIGAFVGALVLTLVLSVLKVYAGLPIVNRFTEACVFKDHIYTNLMMAFTSFVIGHYMLQYSHLLVRLILFCLLLGIIFYVFFMSNGRSGYIVFMALWLLFCLQRLSWKGLGMGLVGLVLLLGLVFTASKPFQEGLSLALKNVESYQLGESNTSLGSRLEYFAETWQLAKKRPWFGFGTGSFKQVYQSHATVQSLLETENPHNEYLNILFQLGVVGLGAFLAIFALIFKESIRLPTPEKWFSQGILVAMMVGCLANSWLMDFTSGCFFVVLTAFCFGALQIKEDLPHE